MIGILFFFGCIRNLPLPKLQNVVANETPQNYKTRNTSMLNLEKDRAGGKGKRSGGRGLFRHFWLLDIWNFKKLYIMNNSINVGKLTTGSLRYCFNCSG